MKDHQICVECGSDDLKNCAPEYPHINECNTCGHPNDAPAIKSKPVKEKEINCKMCNKRKATSTAIKPFSKETIEVCDKCFEDIIDEENE